MRTNTRTAMNIESENTQIAETSCVNDDANRKSVLPVESAGAKARRTRGEHCVNVFISYELKQRLDTLAERYDRTMADMVRALLQVGIPVMEGISEAEEKMMKEYVELFRRARRLKRLKEL